MADIFVSTDGDDANAGTSRTTPVRTFYEAYNNKAATGDRIIFLTPNGEWREGTAEGWATDYPNLSRSAVTLDICSDDPRRPAVLSGNSGVYGVRFTNGTCRFHDIVFRPADSSTTSVIGSSTANVLADWKFNRCRIEAISDLSSTAYCVSQGSTGDWTNAEFHDCEIIAGGASGGAVNITEGTFGFYNCVIRGGRLNGATNYGIRAQDGVTSLEIVNCDISANIGINFGSATQAENAYLHNNKIVGGAYGVLINGTTTGTMEIIDTGANVFAKEAGWVVAGNNVKANITNFTVVAQNPALGLPTDGGYSAVTGSAVNGTLVAHGAASHALLAGIGAADTYFHGITVNGSDATYAAVFKDTGRAVNNTFVGGSLFSVYFKGATGWEVRDNYVYQNHGGAVWGSAVEGITQTSGNNTRGNSVMVDNGDVFSLSNTGDDGTSTYNDNGYVLVDAGVYGAIYGTTVNTLADVRTQLGGTNEDASREDLNRASFDTMDETVAAIQAKTDDMTFTVANQLDVNLKAIDDVTAAAVRLALSAGTMVIGSAITGTLSDTQCTTNLTETTDDHYKFRVLLWTSGVLAGSVTDITAYNGTSKTLTYSALPTGESPSNGDTFIIV